MTDPVLQVEDLQVRFFTDDGVLPAVDGISFDVEAGEALGLVGESAAGKSQTALALLRLIRPPGRITGGQIWFQGRDLLALSESEMRALRGRKISMIFQEPMAALNPTMTIGDQLTRVIKLHREPNERKARVRAVEMLVKVGIPSPEERLRQYPYQFSGGMCQRVAIAMALACEPDLLIADEPTTALDVTVQAQIMDLLYALRRETGTAVVLISHDLRLVTDFCNKVAVMYSGRIVEQGVIDTVMSRPLHPYTQGLAGAIPRLEAEGRHLPTIPGQVPDLLRLPSGCRFHPRCPHATVACAQAAPRLLEPEAGRRVACHLYDPEVPMQIGEVAG